MARLQNLEQLGLGPNLQRGSRRGSCRSGRQERGGSPERREGRPERRRGEGERGGRGRRKEGREEGGGTLGGRGEAWGREERFFELEFQSEETDFESFLLFNLIWKVSISGSFRR